MKKVYRIKSLWSSVTEDSYEEGELGEVGSWSGREILGQKFYTAYDSIGDILRTLNSEYLYMWKDADNVKNWALFDDDSLTDEVRLDCDILVDAENSPASDKDVEKWRSGEMKLYNAHSVLYVTAEYVTYSPKDELTNEAQSLGLETI